MRWAERARRLTGALAVVGGVLAAGTATAETLLQRGAYLMNGVVACGNCHTPKGPDGKAIAGQEMAGGFTIDTPVFRAVAPNITPDKETGIGSWSDQEIIDAIRNGRRPDGTIIGPPMPISWYRQMSDTDAKALVAYLRSLKPIRNKTEKSTYRMPLPPTYGPTVARVAAPPAGTTAAYGAYLSAIGHCMECHTPMVRGQTEMSKLGAGGFKLEAPGGGEIVTPNLTPANKDGIAGWTDAQVASAIRTGVTPNDRHLVRIMAFDWYQNINNRDMNALVAYLRTLKPAVP